MNNWLVTSIVVIIFVFTVRKLQTRGGDVQEKQKEPIPSEEVEKPSKEEGEDVEKFKALMLNTTTDTYETVKVPITEEDFEYNGQVYNVKQDAIYTHKVNPLKALFLKILPERKTSEVDLDDSDKITGHVLTPSRIVEEVETDSSDTIEYDDGIYDIGSVFTGVEGDIVLINKSDPIPKPETAYDNNDGGIYTDPSVSFKERLFNVGIVKKLSQMPEGGFGIDLGSIPPWAIILLFIVVILVLGGV